ncbi:hypothetical protein DPMN_116898 [Dreissena polymorpha]|uniref:PDE8-like REC N-terminal domain-containing protein n=1 Tax=Dreissena polymorpha TaxID=45954 RepID=A0A9D4KNW8_DREPO|nr:hypothetical protein DPMN_116898 [Dreissena polymorpha]
MGICHCCASRPLDHLALQSSDSEVMLGPMKMKQKCMSILLVFAQEDYQSDGFWWAAEKGGYKCNISRDPESALETYQAKNHDVVIIDHRSNKSFDAEALCRSIRATKASEHTVIVAVTKKHIHTDKEEPSILPLLKAGFSRVAHVATDQPAHAAHVATDQPAHAANVATDQPAHAAHVASDQPSLCHMKPM